MTGFLLPGMLCIAVLVLGAFVGLVVMALRPAGRPAKDAQNGSSREATKPASRPWQSWMLYLGIALVMAIWTIVGAVFFLLIVWLMRQNPAAGSDFQIGNNEKKTARRAYTWLFLSPLLTVPVFILGLDNAYGGSTNEGVVAALLPLVFHLPLLAGLTSKSVFVYRHTQQSILLMALRAGLAALVASSQYPEDGLWLFLLGNGGLWLFGSIWGWTQVNRGACWLMQRRGERIERPAGEVGNFPPQIHLEKSREFIQGFKNEAAKNHALAAFRKGDREIRLQALWVLEVLEQVEKF